MEYITAFSQKYLNKCGKILEHEILSDGNCFYHSLEYANADCDLDPLYRTIVNSRRRICNLVIEQIKRAHGVRRESDLSRAARVKAQTFENMKETKEWTQDECELQGAVDKQKDLFIITRNSDEPLHLQDIRVIRPSGRENLPFEGDKMLFLIHLVHNTDLPDNMGIMHQVATGVHFITFQRESLYEPIEPNDEFIDRINKYTTTGGFNDFYEDRLDSDGVVTYRFNIDNFDPELKNGIIVDSHRGLRNIESNSAWENPANFGNEPTWKNYSNVKQPRVSDNNNFWKSLKWVAPLPYRPPSNNELPKNISEQLRQINSMFNNFNIANITGSRNTQKTGRRNPAIPPPRGARPIRHLTPGPKHITGVPNEENVTLGVKPPSTRKAGKPPVPRGVRVKAASPENNALIQALQNSLKEVPKNRTPSPGEQEAINLAKALEMSEKEAAKKNKSKPKVNSSPFKFVKGLPLGVNAPKLKSSLKSIKPRVAHRKSVRNVANKSASPGEKEAIALVNAAFGKNE
jgi:hypothetical protein